MDFTTLVKELGVDKMTPEAQEKFFAQLVDTVHTRVGLRLDEVLTPEQQQQLDAIIEKQGDDAGFDAFEQMYPDFRKLYQEELDKLTQDLKAAVFTEPANPSAPAAAALDVAPTPQQQP